MKVQYKRIVIALFAVGLAISIPVSAWAVAGACSNCHTMHNYQDGSDNLANDGSTATGGPSDDLTIGNGCAGCHVNSGAANTGSGIPLVYSDGSAPLAGGDFYWAVNGTDHELAHNVSGILGQDNVMLSNTPPGFVNTFNANITVGSNWAGNQLACYGTHGCHGDGTNSLGGAHHSNTVGGEHSTATTVANSFRFLKGIKGFEDDDWEFETATDHNLYYGKVRANEADVDTGALSYFCATCHGDFHSGSGTDGSGNERGLVSDAMTWDNHTWIRHPIDIVVPDSGEYANYDTYDPLVPVAATTVTAAAAADDNRDTAGNDNQRIITCLSCHRAHGSQYRDILRFDYTGMVLNTSNATYAGKGCFKCHSAKDGV